MENLDWTTHTRGHWEADHCGMCLHVFKSLNGCCWSVYNQEIEIDGRGAMVPFEEAKARAVAAAERWNNHELAAVTAQRDAHLADIRATFGVLAARGYDDDNAPIQTNVRRVFDALDRVTAERDALREWKSRAEAELRATREALDMPPPIRTDKTISQRAAIVMGELAALKKRVADAPRITVFEMDGEQFHSRPEPRDWRATHKPIKHGDNVAWVRLEDGDK